MELYIQSWNLWGQEPGQDVPRLDFVPAMMRRRLSTLTKMAFTVAQQASDNQLISSVFTSRHGDLHKTTLLLQQLAAAEPLSPSQFALSVHNAISGQYSIVRADMSDTTALAAGEDSFHYGLVEAAARLATEPELEKMLVVYSDEAVPALYQAFCPDDPVGAFAMAVVLHKCTGQRFQLRWQQGEQQAEPEQARKVADFFLSHQAELVLTGQQRQWLWSRG